MLRKFICILVILLFVVVFVLFSMVWVLFFSKVVVFGDSFSDSGNNVIVIDSIVGGF